MIDFQRLKLAQKAEYESILFSCPDRGCEYSFANLYLWGHQQAAILHGCVAFFSHFNGRSVYPYPIGHGDRKAAIWDILNDAQERGIPCRITNMRREDWAELEGWFPGKFLVRIDRDSFDYVYDIDDLADLKGRKFQKKRNHVNRFLQEHPDYRVQPLTKENITAAREMVQQWYDSRIQEDPHGDYLLERKAMERAFRCYDALGMEGLILSDGGEILAMTMASRLSDTIMDVHFEKAREDEDGAYAMINREFARYLRAKYPELRFLNREDDIGLEGLRRAKLSYQPHHMIEKCWACLPEDVDGTL